MRTIDTSRGEFTTSVFSSSLTIAKLQMLIRSPKSVVNHVQTSLARQCYNLGMTRPFDPSLKVIRYQPIHPDDLAVQG